MLEWAETVQNVVYYLLPGPQCSQCELGRGQALCVVPLYARDVTVLYPLSGTVLSTVAGDGGLFCTEWTPSGTSRDAEKHSIIFVTQRTEDMTLRSTVSPLLLFLSDVSCSPFVLSFLSFHLSSFLLLILASLWLKF